MREPAEEWERLKAGAAVTEWERARPGEEVTRDRAALGANKRMDS